MLCLSSLRYPWVSPASHVHLLLAIQTSRILWPLVRVPSSPWVVTVTKRSENDNTPQPLDQWTNSPFISQQVGNCKSFTLTHYLADLFAMHRGPRIFTLTHYLADLFAMHRGPRSIPLCIQHHIKLTSLSFNVSQTSHSWDFNILPWKSNVKIMSEVKVWSHNVSLTFYRLTFFSFLVNMPSHSSDKTFFFKLTLKTQAQCHGWGESWKSQHGSNILSSHIPFIPSQSAIPLLRYDSFKILPLKSKVKVMVEVKFESHKVGVASYRLTSLLLHVNRPSHSWEAAFLKFDLENPWPRSWVRWTMKVTTWVQHSIDSHPFHSMSISYPFPEIWLFQNLTLKIQGQGHGLGERWKSQSGCNILSTHIPFIPCQSALPRLRYSIFKIWPWKSKVKVKWPWCCTTTGLDNSIERQMV